MSQIISIDYGRSTVKGASGFEDEDFIIFPTALTYDDKSLDRKISSTEKDHVIKNPLKYLKVKIDNDIIGIGEIVNNMEYAVNPSNFDDIESEDTKNLILTAIACLLDDSDSGSIANIKLALTLSADQYYLKKDVFSKVYNNKRFKVDVYNHKRGSYETKEFYVEDVLIKQQGFFAFMHSILDEDDKITKGKEEVLERAIGVIDIGHYSTDLFVCDNLDSIPIRKVESKIPGMDKAIADIRSSLYEEYELLPKEHKIQQSLENNKRITKSGLEIDDQKIIKREFEKLGRLISSKVKNKLPIGINEIDNWFICGGGSYAEDLKNKISQSFQRDLEVIENPRMANAIGAFKLAKRNL